MYSGGSGCSNSATKKPPTKKIYSQAFLGLSIDTLTEMASRENFSSLLSVALLSHTFIAWNKQEDGGKTNRFIWQFLVLQHRDQSGWWCLLQVRLRQTGKHWEPAEQWSLNELVTRCFSQLQIFTQSWKRARHIFRRHTQLYLFLWITLCFWQKPTQGFPSSWFNWFNFILTSRWRKKATWECFTFHKL